MQELKLPKTKIKYNAACYILLLLREWRGEKYRWLGNIGYLNGTGRTEAQ